MKFLTLWPVFILGYGFNEYLPFMGRKYLIINKKIRSDPNFHLLGADLTGADLREAALVFTILQSSNLTMADLGGASLKEADLRWANFEKANLRDANLRHADFQETDFKETRLSITTFDFSDLSKIKNLETCVHELPSTVGAESLRISGQLPLSFLQGVGFTTEEIEHLPVFTNTDQIKFNSCFISYSSYDGEFVDRLYTDLQNNGIKCWLAKNDLVPGEFFRKEIDTQIKTREKVILILSKNSIKSRWVCTEVEVTLKEEEKRDQNIIMPYKLDDSVMRMEDVPWFKHLTLERHIGDFTKWKDRASYEIEFDKLVKYLKQ